jgi:hypothetical protein
VKRLGIFAWILIVLLSGATLGVFLFFFLLWFFLIKKPECPICCADDLEKSRAVAL